MSKMEIRLSEISGEYLSKEDFYRIAHISKSTALWLIETGRVNAEKPENKGKGYKIPKTEVERFLKDRSINPSKYRRSNRCNRYRYYPSQPYSKRLGGKIRAIVERDIVHLPDVLISKRVSMILGYDLREIYAWSKARSLHALRLSGKLYYPKQLLLDFVSSKEYYDIQEKSKEHIELLRRALYE